MDEPVITVNGRKLTIGQAMTMRVALSSFDVNCGNDEHGRKMTLAYAKRKSEILALMLSTPPARNPAS